jgi:PBP superfamily domain
MKLNKLSLVCAAACATFAGQASAQLANSAANQAVVAAAKANPAATGGPRVLYISGASAVQGGFQQITTSLLVPGSEIRFQSSSANDYRAVAGKLKNDAGTGPTAWLANQDVIIINRAKGGSVFGVNPVAGAGNLIESLNISVASCTTGSGTTATPYVCAVTSDVTGTATPSLDDNWIRPDAGVSDVAPNLFDSAFNTEGEPSAPALDAAALATLTATPLYNLAFGLPMSRNLPLFDINKSAVSAIMTGNVGTWNQVNTALPADDILICRRTNGSGSQAVANLYYGNYPCDTGARSNPPADRAVGAAWNGSNAFAVEGATNAINVVENSTSGDVRTCMNTAFDASAKPFVATASLGTFNPATGAFTGSVGYTNYFTFDRSGVNRVPVQFRDGRAHKAVGVLSMDSLSSSTTTSKWSFRAMDGAGEITWGGVIGTPPVPTGTGRLPTLASLTNGTWDQQGVISINVPTRTSTSNPKAGLIADFIAQAQIPALLASQTNLKFAAAAPAGTPDPTATGNVTRVSYPSGDQCAPLNRNN